MRKCPDCAESIPKNAASCPRCGADLQDDRSAGSYPRQGRSMSPMWIVAIVLAGAFGLIIVCGGILAGFTLPAIQAAREAARRAQCANNLKMIGLALAQYESQYGRFPPAYIADADGKPMHSWRVLILPYLDEESLYSEYDFSEPW